MKKMLSLSAIVIIISSTMFSCKKGDIGPAGPAGSTGATGVAGPAGTNGTNGAKGDTGTANVIYSDWITVTQADWTGIGTSAITHTITADTLTDDIRDRGIVLVYHDFGGSVKLLPYAYSATSDHFDFTFATGSISLRDYHQDGSTIAGISDTRFRYVLVPGGVFSGRVMNNTVKPRTADELKGLTYHELAALFNIPATGSNLK